MFVAPEGTTAVSLPMPSVNSPADRSIVGRLGVDRRSASSSRARRIHDIQPRLSARRPDSRLICDDCRCLGLVEDRLHFWRGYLQQVDRQRAELLPDLPNLEAATYSGRLRLDGGFEALKQPSGLAASPSKSHLDGSRHRKSRAQRCSPVVASELFGCAIMRL